MKTFTSNPSSGFLRGFIPLLLCILAGFSPASAQLAAPPAQRQLQAPAFKVGPLAIKLVGTANVNEQALPANMNIREVGEFE